MDGAADTQSGAAPMWLDELDLTPGPNVLQMGLRPLGDRPLFDVDEHRSVELEAKQQLFAARPRDVSAAVDGSEEAGDEVLAMVLDDLRSIHEIEPELPPDDLHPLVRAGLVVQDDLTIMAPLDGAYVLAAAFVAFPSGWYLDQKIGRPLAAIHAPIPHYATELSSKVDRIFERVRVDRPLWRRNWFVYDNPALFQPEEPTNDVTLDFERLGEQLTIRSERQTIVRLPKSGAVLFAIRTQSAPLAVLRQRPDVAADMHDYFEGSPADTRHNKGIAPYADLVLRWLAAVEPFAAR